MKAPIKKAPPPAAAAAASKSKPAAGPGPGNAALESFKYKHSPEDAEALATDLIPTSIAADFSDANWKLRLAALEEMTSWVQGSVAELDAEVVVRFLIKKGGGEKNFQVSVGVTLRWKYFDCGVFRFLRSCMGYCVSWQNSAHLLESPLWLSRRRISVKNLEMPN